MKLVILDFETANVLVYPYEYSFGDAEEYILELIEQGKLDVSLDNIQYMTTDKDIEYYES
jgi:hypothetical protein